MPPGSSAVARTRGAIHRVADIASSSDGLLTAVAEIFGINREVLVGPSQARAVIRARISAAYLLRSRYGLPVKQIGLLIGRSDQTVSDLLARARQAISADHELADLIR